MALLNRKILFVHINKSCGDIITDNFKQNGLNELTGFHRSLEDMLILSKTQYNINKEDLFIFTIVRNPWERMLSMYLFYHKNNFNSPEFFSGNYTIDNDFNNWIEYIYSNKFDRMRRHSAVNIFKYCFCNQLNWVKYKDTNNIIENVNIYKIENLNLDEFLKNTLKLNNVDAFKKVNPTNHKHYSQYYNNKSIKLVEEHYKDDIEYFNYKFELII